MIWHPDVYFANARSATFQDITEPNFLVWIYPNGISKLFFPCKNNNLGHVWYDCRVSLTAICMMDLYKVSPFNNLKSVLFKYPLDEQQCNLRLLSCKSIS